MTSSSTAATSSLVTAPLARPHSPYTQEVLNLCAWQCKPDGTLCLQHGTVRHPETQVPQLVFGQDACTWFDLTPDEMTHVIRIRFTAKGVPFPNREDVSSEADKLQIRFHPDTPPALMQAVADKARQVLTNAGYPHTQYQAHDVSNCCGFGCYGCVRYQNQ